MLPGTALEKPRCLSALLPSPRHLASQGPFSLHPNAPFPSWLAGLGLRLGDAGPRGREWLQVSSVLLPVLQGSGRFELLILSLWGCWVLPFLLRGSPLAAVVGLGPRASPGLSESNYFFKNKHCTAAGPRVVHRGAACVQGAELSSGSQRLCHCWKPKPGAFWPKYSALGVFPKEQPGQGGLVAPWLVVFWVSLQQPALQRRCQQRSSEPWQLPGFPVSSSSFISTICSSITGTNSDHGLVLGVMSPPRSPRHLPLLPSQLCAPRCGWGAAGSQDFGARLLAHFTGFGLFSCWGKGILG